MKVHTADSVLIWWFITSTIWDLAVWGAAAYLIFGRGHSRWWFLLAFMLTQSSTLFKVLKKKYGIAEEEKASGKG